MAATQPPIRVGIIRGGPARMRATARLLHRIGNASNRSIILSEADPAALLDALRARQLDIVIATADRQVDTSLARSSAFDSALGGSRRAAFTRRDDPRFTALVDREARRTALIVR